MSRIYETSIQIRGYDETKVALLDEAWREAWGTHCELRTEDDDEETILSDYRVGALRGGVDEEEFAGMVSAALWEANGDCCHIYLTMTCVDERPTSEFEFSLDAYRAWENAAQQVSVSARKPDEPGGWDAPSPL